MEREIQRGGKGKLRGKGKNEKLGKEKYWPLLFSPPFISEATGPYMRGEVVRGRGGKEEYAMIGVVAVRGKEREKERRERNKQN